MSAAPRGPEAVQNDNSKKRLQAAGRRSQVAGRRSQVMAALGMPGHGPPKGLEAFWREGFAVGLGLPEVRGLPRGWGCQKPEALPQGSGCRWLGGLPDGWGLLHGWGCRRG